MEFKPQELKRAAGHIDPGGTELGRKVKALQIKDIRQDGGTQARIALSESTVNEYAELMRAGVDFPPVRTWFDGQNHWLTDGFQRVAAAGLAGREQIAAEILRGTLADAQWDSFRANACHGLRRTESDVRSIVERALMHPNSRTLSNTQLARHLHVPEATLRRWRKHLSSSSGEDTHRIAVRNGTMYSIEVANIGKTHRKGKDAHKSRSQLRRDLEDMKQLASPEVRRVLNIMGNWVFGGTKPVACVKALESVVLLSFSGAAKSKIASVVGR